MSRPIRRTPQELAFALALLVGACSSPQPSPSASATSAVPGSDEPALAKSVPPRERPAVAPPKPEEPPAPPPPRLDAPWAYVMSVDHGIRSDDGGKGAFLAPRYHGRHNGLDLLAPIGTVVQAPCDGKARAGTSGSFGRWVQVVCKLPAELSAGKAMYASIFYSHLSKTNAKKGDFERVRRAESVGAVGKTGNASGSDVMPHLHLEIIVHDDEDSALEETHSGRSQGSSRAAGILMAQLERLCLTPNGFESRGSDLARARRVDPFVFLTCVAPDKPAFTKPRAPLDAASERWSEHYRAKTFDVDVGRRLSASEPATARR